MRGRCAWAPSLPSKRFQAAAGPRAPNFTESHADAAEPPRESTSAGVSSGLPAPSPPLVGLEGCTLIKVHLRPLINYNSGFHTFHV